jgi:hypothetical protein
MRFVFLCYFELLWAPEQIEIDPQYGNIIQMFAPIARCYGHDLADPACDDGEAWPRPQINQYSASRHNAFYIQRLADWRKAFKGDSFDFDYHLMWANWHQFTDTHLARLFYDDLQDLKRIGLDGILSCQSLRVFYPSGLAMTVLAEALWNPDVPWDEMRQRYLVSAYGEHAAWAGAYLDTIEGHLDTGDPHWRALPFSTADEGRLSAVAAFLDTSLVEVKARYAATSEKTQRKSLDLLLYHIKLLQIVVRAYQLRLQGDAGGAVQALDRAAEYLRRTEPRYSTYIDTMLALRPLEQAKRQMESG